MLYEQRNAEVAWMVHIRLPQKDDGVRMAANWEDSDLYCSINSHIYINENRFKEWKTK